MSLKNFMMSGSKCAAISFLIFTQDAQAKCEKTIPFDDTRIYVNKDTHEVYTPSGLYFDQDNARKLVLTHTLQLGNKMNGQLVSQETMPDGKLKCHYTMPLQALSFEASFDPNAPLPAVRKPSQPKKIKKIPEAPAKPVMAAPAA